MKIKVSIILCVLVSSLYAQKEERNFIRKGNSLYSKEKYTDAEIDYRKALEKNAASPEALFNLGNALFRQQKPQEAAEQYKIAAEVGKDSIKVAEAYYNMGNVFLHTKNYQQSIEAYKQSLRRNPNDNEARYNLRLAQLLLKKQQQEQQQEKQQKEEKKDQNKNKDNKDKNQNKPKEEPQKPEQQPQPQSGQMSKENAQQILDAMQNDEKQTQERVNKAIRQQQKQRKTDKDW